MFALLGFLIFSPIGTLGAQWRYAVERDHPSTEQSNFIQPLYYNNPNVDDARSSRHVKPRTQPPLQILHDVPKYSPYQVPITYHQPREDPRLFYQSDVYLKENNRKNLNRYVSYIYPGKEVVRADERLSNLLHAMSYKARPSVNQLCIKCPDNIKILLKPGNDRVKLRCPRLTTCSGENAPRNVRINQSSGPLFGTKIERGTHFIVGDIIANGKILRTCQMQVEVVSQNCSTPQYLKAECYENSCIFSCRNKSLTLFGNSTSTCDNRKWTRKLPVCKSKRAPPNVKNTGVNTYGASCKIPPPPLYGKIRCRGPKYSKGYIGAGTKCWVQCKHGRKRWSPPDPALCIGGTWTRVLTCQP